MISVVLGSAGNRCLERLLQCQWSPCTTAWRRLCIPAVFMFMGASPTCHSNELIVWRNIYPTAIYVQHGHFDALMTIDLGAMCWAVGLLAAIKFIYLQT